jgi:hypothetical protein
VHNGMSKHRIAHTGMWPHGYWGRMSMLTDPMKRWDWCPPAMTPQYSLRPRKLPPTLLNITCLSMYVTRVPPRISVLIWMKIRAICVVNTKTLSRLLADGIDRRQIPGGRGPAGRRAHADQLRLNSRCGPSVSVSMQWEATSVKDGRKTL